MRWLFLLGLAAAAHAQTLPNDWKRAHRVQDRAALDRIAAQARQAARDSDAASLYRAALAQHLRAEVAMELRDRNASGAAARDGVEAARKAVALQPNNAEYHRLLGALCAQVIPANVLAALQYGKCAMEEVDRALELDAKSPAAWLSRGVGNYYLPESFGGGAQKALADIDKALQLAPRLAEAWLWRGIVLRKLNRNAEARESFERSLKFDPERLWAKQQLEKTPAQ